MLTNICQMSGSLGQDWRQGRVLASPNLAASAQMSRRPDPLLTCTALIVEGDNPLCRARRVGDDEADARNKLARMPVDLGDNPARLGPASGLIGEAGVEPPHMVRG